MGPEHTNNLINSDSWSPSKFAQTTKVDGKKIASFQLLPWWKSPDGLILAYLRMARKIKADPAINHRLLLPVDYESLQALYAAAHTDDLAKLDAVSVSVT